MLQINMADVMNVIGSLTPYLIAIGVLFVLALIITFAVNKKTVKEVATRKIRVKGQNVCLARRVAGVRFGLFECRLSGCSRCR